MSNIKIGQRYRHFKGMIIVIDFLGKHSETLEEMVCYHHEGTEEYWVRPLSLFESKVDKQKYPEVEQEYRFQKIEE